MAIRKKGKLRDMGMVFKPSFKCLKNEKSVIKVILKPECLFYQNIYIYFFILFYIRRANLTQTKKKVVQYFKNIPFSILSFYYVLNHKKLIPL